MYSPGHHQPHHNRHHRNSARNQNQNSCCCCECIRLNSNLFTSSRSRREPECHDQYSQSDEPTDMRWPSAHYEQKKQFFEHYNTSPDNLSEDDERFDYYRNFQRSGGPRHLPQRRNVVRQKRQLPQPKQRKYFESASPAPPMQRYPSGTRRNRQCDQQTQTDLRYHENHDQAQNQNSYENRGSPAIPNPVNRAWQKGFYRTEKISRRYSQSDVEQRQRPQTFPGPIEEFQTPGSDQPKNHGSTKEIISVWRRSDFPEQHHGHGQESNSDDVAHFETKTMRAKHQSSQSYLNLAKIVQNTKPQWEERIANDLKFGFHRQNPAQNRKVFKQVILHKTTSSTTMISERHHHRPKQDREPLSFTSSFTSGIGTDNEYEKVKAEETVTHNNVKTKLNQQNSNEAMSVKNQTHELDHQHRKESTEESHTELRYRVSARLSLSSPDLPGRLSEETGQHGQEKAKSLPSRGKFKHPEFEHLNLSGMRLNSNQRDSNATESPSLTVKQAQSNFVEAKFFQTWQTGIATKKYAKIQAKRSEIKDGLQVLSHSRSHQNIIIHEKHMAKVTKTGGSVISAVSAPPAPIRKWYNLLDAVNPWAASKPELAPLQAPTIEARDPSSDSTSALDVEFAMEIDARLPTQHASYMDVTLLRLSKDYNSLVQADARSESLDVQDSKLMLNTSMENLDTQNQSKKTTKTGYIHKEEFVWKGKSFLSLVQKQPGQTLDDESHRICQFCLLSITDFADSEKQIVHVKGKNMYWHSRCFKCTACQTSLENQNHYFWNNKVYCSQHYAHLAHVPQCRACHEFILDKTITMAMGFPWHKNHFQCVSCKRPLIDTKFVKCGQELGICFECQQKLYSKKCTFCGKTILPTQIYVRSGAHFWHSNDTCIQCQTCQKSLRERSRIFVRAGKTYCNRYCAQMYISPAITLSHENPELPE